MIGRTALRWYSKKARKFPWRYRHGQKPNLYFVWLSEVMLQQTQTTSVIPYFEKWIARWGSVEALATAPLAQILAAWAGLGYYSRARSLHKTARMIAGAGGAFPNDYAQLIKLPGIGDYTANAILAFGHLQHAVVVDGNIKRILSRYFAIPFNNEKKLRAAAEKHTPKKRAGDYAQALMDIGATLCLAKVPLCEDCPLAGTCVAFQKNKIADFGRKAPTGAKPKRQGKAYVLVHQGKVLLVRRPDKGLLGGTKAFPSSGWDGSADVLFEGSGKLKKHPQPVMHTFTHFHLTLWIYSGEVSAKQAAKVEGRFYKQIKSSELPTLMKKVWQAYQAGA